MGAIAHSSMTVDTATALRNAQADCIDEARIADGLMMPGLAQQARNAADWYGRQLRALADGYEIAAQLPELER